MKKHILYILILIPTITFANTDRFFEIEFGNVSVRIETGLYNEEVENVRMIGKYASILCDNMSYDKPVLLDFKHDHNQLYKGEVYRYIDYGTGGYELVSYWTSGHDSLLGLDFENPVNYRNVKERSQPYVSKESGTIKTKDETQKIVIREFGYSFDIKSTLKLLHYALENKSKLKKKLISDTIHTSFSNVCYVFNSIPKQQVDSIVKSNNQTINKILNEKIYKPVNEKNTFQYSYYTVDNKYVIYYKDNDKTAIIDTVDHIFSLETTTRYSPCLFIFESVHKMKVYKKGRYINDKNASIKSYKIPIDPFEFVESISVKNIDADIYLISYIGSLGLTEEQFIYLANDDILITDFKSYIHKWRNKEEKQLPPTK